jgi:hypothetical protein
MNLLLLTSISTSVYVLSSFKPSNRVLAAGLLQIIYVARNVKDTCVSYYHHCKLLEGYTGSFEDYCKLFLGGSGE